MTIHVLYIFIIYLCLSVWVRLISDIWIKDSIQFHVTTKYEYSNSLQHFEA
jgi:hypothetical protein